jgi:hypothetical protein
VSTTARWRFVGFLGTLGAAALGLAVSAAAPAPHSAAAPRPTRATVAPPIYANPAPFSAAPTTPADSFLADEIPRRVLALYDGSESLDTEGGRAIPVSAENALAHRLAALPLSHLGLAVDYYDVNQPTLPDARTMSRYRGVLSWFGDPRMIHPDAYLRWLLVQLDAGRRVVIIDGLGAYADLEGRPAAPALVTAVMRALGAEPGTLESEDSSQIAVVAADPALIGFEAPLPKSLSYYRRFVAAPDAQVYLSLALTQVPDSKSDVVWTSARGGYVLPGVAWREDAIADRFVTRWVLDVFTFLTRALALDDVPRVDITTLNGSRIFYSQVDGDGMETLSELDYQSRCGEIIRDRIFRAYDLPFTASIVVGATAPPPAGRGSTTDVAVARSLLALDNVEIGSHGYAHPFDWRDRRGTSLAVSGLPGYSPNAEWEIARSVEYVDRELAPIGKSCRIMLWTGDCNPNEEQLAVAYRLGLRNLNGGDPRMDAHYPSYAHLVAPVHRVGALSQYYTSAANDFVLTGEWKPPYYGFRNVLQTFERAGAPRRISAVDVYFHFYSARNVPALTALTEVLDWAVKQPLAPIFASEYVDIVHDAESARIARAGERTWEIRKGPALRTVRFDGKPVSVDLARSRGVLGYVYEPALRATYVHLDGGVAARVALAAGAPAQPYLERASHWVDRLRFDDGAITFETHGPGRHRFVFAGMPVGRRYRIASGGHATVDADGRLTIALAGGTEIMRVQALPVTP